MIDILINHYNEQPELIGRLLHSIEQQTDIDLTQDVKVYIFSDGLTNLLSEEFLESFSYPIVYEAYTHRGVCTTRNALMEKSHGEYMIFCDADDVLHNPSGLSLLLKTANDKTPDIASFAYLEEIPWNGIMRTIKVQRDILHLQGMMFKRSFIKENSIHFPDEMETGGDKFFIWLAFHMTKNYLWIPECFYTWKWNENSVTRSDEHYIAKNYPRMVQCYTLLTDYLIEIDRTELANELVSSCILTFYLDWHSDKFENMPEEYIEPAKSAIGDYIKAYIPYYVKLSSNYLQNKFIMTFFSKGVKPPKSGFVGVNAWISDICSD